MKIRPDRPRRNERLAGAVILLIGSTFLSGCRTPGTSSPVVEVPGDPGDRGAPDVDDILLEIPDDSAPQDTLAVTAPVFNHGRGYFSEGSFLVQDLTPYMDPPVFLPEEEAMPVIREELSRAGIELAAWNVPAARLILPDRDALIMAGREASGWRTEVRCNPRRNRLLLVDGVDRKRGVAVEYVSRRDLNRLGLRSGYSYNFRSAARWIAEHLDRTASEPLIFGFFYDPTCDSIQGSRYILRFQVRDFLAWLKEREEDA